LEISSVDNSNCNINNLPNEIQTYKEDVDRKTILSKSSSFANIAPEPNQIVDDMNNTNDDLIDALKEYNNLDIDLNDINNCS